MHGGREKPPGPKGGGGPNKFGAAPDFWLFACRSAACCCSCSKQCILNQFDRRPYREPLFDIPTSKHLRSRHALQAVLFFLLMMHSPLFLHSEIDDKLLYDRPKNDCKETKKSKLDQTK